ncbi:LysR substrate-binding domain-containing protein [Pseudomonas sp. NFR16]|uniref:LysR substrate-binding domain-containing protein n=1 Tax=Pseudomonas sp. NFR16 TaxID=1566248 RepID=UPI0008D87185|nr:LysR substrate-binding domain-containing protein [Pseudomonas sp. NFR16]SEI59979.1 transcriptional regulator, LysR family [Pseudomonas sp. NFR16]
MNKLELLKTFIRVAEMSSFTQASDALNLPRSTVSEHIRGLEDLLDTRLLLRTTRKVQTTPDGQVLYERSKDLLAQMDELENLFRQDNAVLSGRLRVDMPTAVARRLVMPRLGEFIARHPLIELEISSTDRRVDLVREGFDCIMRVGELPDTSLVARSLGHLQMVNCVSRSYAERFGVPRTLEDLQQHRLVNYVSSFGGSDSMFEYHRDGKDCYVAMPCSVTVNYIEAYEAACLGGLGIVQIPRLAERYQLARGDLVEILPDYLPAPMPVSLLYAHRRHLPQRCRVFMDWMEQLLGEYGVQR